MHTDVLPLNGLRAFEAAARHLSLTRAAAELHVSPSALSHQIRGLEDLLGQRLFERRTRAIALTPAGRLLQPGLRAGFAQIREAVAELRRGTAASRILVVSTPPGLTAKWLAPRLYRFSQAHPDIDVRISSTLANADFTTDGVDIAIRNMALGAAPPPGLAAELLFAFAMTPVCSPGLLARLGPFEGPQALRRVPLIHDETLMGRAQVPGWGDWLAAAGVGGVAVERGLRFSSADHALDAAIEGAGVLLAYDILAHDDLRTGRLVQPFELTIPVGRGFRLVYPLAAASRPNLAAFRAWVGAEMAAMPAASATPPGRTRLSANKRRKRDVAEGQGGGHRGR